MNARLVTLLTIVAALLLAAPASARITELGVTTEMPNPSCPARPCFAIGHTTAYQVDGGGRANLFVVPRAGRVVAVTLKLAKPSASQITFFNQRLGGASRVRVVTMVPFTRRQNRFRFRVLEQSEDIQPLGFFGTTVQLPLKTSLAAPKGSLVGLSIPTWAPILATGLASTNHWRASRGEPCQDTFRQTVQRIGQVTPYFCDYRPERLTYTVTVVDSPIPPRS